MIRSLLLGLVAACLLTAAGADAQSLRGSRSSVDLMYEQALSHQLHFYETSAGLRRAVARGEFVRLNGNANYALGSVSYPYVLPVTRTFVERLAAQYRASCGERLVVTSAARPRSMRLANGVSRSVHPTGMAIDLRRPTRSRCLTWLRRTLTSLDAAGVIEATEESRPPHFHVAVFPGPYRSYLQGRGGTVRIASSEAPPSSSAGDAEGERVYRVRRGDSLWSIARRNRVSIDQLKAVNSLASSRIVAGQVLRIPGAAAQ